MKKTNRYYRIWTITSMSIGFFLEIWRFERSRLIGEEKEAERERLLRKQAREYRETALRLEGLMIKVGQFLSTRADLLPPAFTEELKGLTDQVAPVPWEAARGVLEEEWRGILTEELPVMGTLPVASASIAVVYRGQLPDGQAVAIKVQRPGIRSIIQADFQAARIVMGLASRFTSWGKTVDMDRLYRETVDIVGKELDFVQEMEYANRFRGQVKPASRIRVPVYMDKLTTKRVLVMEWIESFPVTDAASIEKHGLDRMDIVKRLAASFLRQVVADGFFHADPHPGNVRLLPDGTLVFLDFGMMGVISPDQRSHILELVQALVVQDYGEVVRSLEKLRFIRKGADREALARSLEAGMKLYLGRGYPSFDDEAVQELLAQVRGFVSGQAIQLPAEFAFMGRAASVVTGVIAALEPEIDYLEIGREVISPLMPGGGTEGKSSLLRPLASGAVKIGRSLLRTPGLLESWLQLRIRREQQELDERRYHLWRTHYEKKQRAAVRFAVLLWCSAVVLYVLGLSVPGCAAAALSLPLLVYYIRLEKRLDVLLAGHQSIQEGDHHG